MSGLRLIDSHGHLQDPAFDVDREAVYARAREAGVGVIIPGYSVASSAMAVELTRHWAGTWALVGVHPHEVEGSEADWSERLVAWLDDPRVVGIGEIGLDYYRDLSPRPLQREAFARQLDLARRAGLPVSVHSRAAEADTLAMLREAGVHGVLHCFTGSRDMARALIDLGFYISFAGVLTFRNADALRAVAALVPLDRLLVETDAPYMAPVPRRGHRNEPAWVVHTAEMLAGIKKMPAQEVFAQLMANSRQAFSRLDQDFAEGGNMFRQESADT
jgi:TatD DNase family protein